MNDDIRNQLEKAERTFEGSPGTIEEGWTSTTRSWSNFAVRAGCWRSDRLSSTKGTTRS